MADTDKKATPPYVSYKTLSNFLARFKDAVPYRIDRDVMGSLSGASQSQVVPALKYLGLISEQGLPTESMKTFVRLEGEDRKQFLRQILNTAYPYLFQTDSFDFKTATVSHLREVLEEYTGAKGETVDRCVAFLKEAAADADIEISRFLTEKRTRTRPKRSSSQAKKQEPRISSAHLDEPRPAEQQSRQLKSIPAQSSLLLWGLFERLPAPGSTWSRTEREQWTATLDHVLTLEYKET
jgi:hypothetical protein